MNKLENWDSVWGEMGMLQAEDAQHEEKSDNFTLVDSHCHLDLSHFDEDRDAVIARARAAGVGLIVNPGIDLEHSRQAIALADTYPDVYAAVGVHPNSSDEFDHSTLAQLRKLASHPKVVAIGEIGLDYHWDTVAPEQQATAFRAQLELAAELGLPVIIHNRDASADVAEILETWVQSGEFRTSRLANRPFAGVLHAFGGDLALAERAYEWNFVLSLGGPVTFKNARSLHEIAPQLRLDRLMLETDAPYLTPHPHRGKRNEPAYVALICQQLANLTGVPAQQIASVTTGTALQFFGLENLPGVEFATNRSSNAV
jgi:TatD DNase family protein